MSLVGMANFEYDGIPDLIAILQRDFKTKVELYKQKLQEFETKSTLSDKEAFKNLFVTTESETIRHLAAQAMQYERFVRGKFVVLTYMVDSLKVDNFKSEKLKKLLEDKNSIQYIEYLNKITEKLRADQESEKLSEERAQIHAKLVALNLDEKERLMHPFSKEYDALSEQIDKLKKRSEDIVKAIQEMGTEYIPLCLLIQAQTILENMVIMLEKLSSALPQLQKEFPKLDVEVQTSAPEKPALKEEEEAEKNHTYKYDDLGEIDFSKKLPIKEYSADIDWGSSDDEAPTTDASKSITPSFKKNKEQSKSHSSESNPDLDKTKAVKPVS